MEATQLNRKASQKESILAETLKERINSKLSAMGISGRELERRAALTQGAIRNILNGTSSNPTMETLNAIAVAFSCSIDELISNQANKSLSNLRSSSPALKALSWQPDLYIAISSSLKAALKKSHIDIDSEKAFYIVQEIYLYLTKKNKTTVDDSLVEWLLDKSL